MFLSESFVCFVKNKTHYNILFVFYSILFYCMNRNLEIIRIVDNFHRRTNDHVSNLINMNREIVRNLSEHHSLSIPIQNEYNQMFSYNYQLCTLYHAYSRDILHLLQTYLMQSHSHSHPNSNTNHSNSHSGQNPSISLLSPPPPPPPIHNNQSNTISLHTLLNTILQQSMTNFSTPDTTIPTIEQIQQATLTCNYSDIENPISTVCPISQNEFTSDSPVTMIHFCRHIFDSNGLSEWFRRNSHCPVCRHDILTDLSSSSIQTTNSTSSFVPPIPPIPPVLSLPLEQPMEEISTYFIRITDENSVNHDETFIPLTQIPSTSTSSTLNSQEISRIMENIIQNSQSNRNAQTTTANLPVRMRTTIRDLSGNIVRQNITDAFY